MQRRESEMSKGNRGFGAALTAGLGAGLGEGGGDEHLAGEGVLASRSDALTRLASGKVVTDRTEFVDPARCRPWRLHNRDLDHLTAESCRDLIDAFLAAKKQRIPAVVRRLRGDPDHDYEIIAGVRRWWTVRWLRAHHHPEFEYLVTVQQLTDEEAFRVSDIENRARKDISDWERAQEYAKALAEFYEGNQSQMAEHLNISRSWLSRMLDVARLPDEVVAAFPDTHDITVRIARDLKPLAANPDMLARMAAEAERLKGERQAGGAGQGGALVAKRLIVAASRPKPTIKPRGRTIVTDAKGNPMLEWSNRGGALTVTVVPGARASKSEILKAFEKLL
jgi:ParB family transcriptional regulator, chromosome partitioning protein